MKCVEAGDSPVRLIGNNTESIVIKLSTNNITCIVLNSFKLTKNIHFYCQLNLTKILKTESLVDTEKYYLSYTKCN